MGIFQDIPNDVLADEKRKIDADNWAAVQRRQLADEWAAEQRRQMMSWFEQAGQGAVGALGQANETVRRIPGVAGVADIAGAVAEPIGKAFEWETENINRPGWEFAARATEGGKFDPISPLARGLIDASGNPATFYENLKQGWEERPEPFPGFKGAIESVGLSSLVGVGEIGKGIQLAGKGAKALAESERVRAGVRAVDRAITNPELARMVPGAPVEDVGGRLSKAIYDMTPEELEAAYQRVNSAEKNIEASLFGDEGAKQYKRAQAISNSSSRSASDIEEAERIIDRMEASLSEQQRNRLFGIGEAGITADEYRQMLNAVRDLDYESPQALGDSLKWAVTKIGKQTDPGLMTASEQQAYAQLRHGIEQARAMGWNVGDVAKAALQGSADRFADPQDAELMLSSWLDRLKPSAGSDVPRLASSGATPPMPPAAPPMPPGVSGAVPPSGGLPERAGNILLSKYPEELRPEILAVYERDPAKFEAARRGVRPDAEVRQDAVNLIDSVGGNGPKSVAKWKSGQAWNAEEVLALREVLASRTKDTLDAYQAVRGGGDSTANLLKFQDAVIAQRLAQEAVSGVTAEAGRALRQFRQQISGALASGNEQRMARILEETGGRETTEGLVDALSKIDLDNPESVYKFVRNSMGKPNLLTELFYNSILSSTGTHARNLIGNTLAAIAAPIETSVAAAVEVPLAAISRRPRERFFGEVPAEIFGAIRALPEAVRKATYIVGHGYGLDDVAKTEVRRREAVPGVFGAVLNQPSRALVAADALFRGIHYSANLNAGAYRIASREGLKGADRVARIADLIANPSDELLEHAGRISRYRVYQQPQKRVGRALVSLQNFDILGQQPLRFIMPFIPTPINLAKYGLERSPLNIFNPSLWSSVIKRDPAAADDLARFFVGSAITASAVAYAADGKITGPAPENRAERDRFYREGKQAYSVKIGDTWVPYNVAEPLNQPLALAAVVVDAMRTGNKDPRGLLGKVVGGVAKNITSQRYLVGISDVMNAIEDPERYGANPVERGIVALGVPFSSLSRGIAGTIDPVRRESKGIQEDIKASVPGLSQTLRPKLNVFGEEVKRESSPLLPMELTKDNISAVDREIGKVGADIGFVGDSIRKVKLTPDEQTEYQRRAGKKTYEVIAKVISSPVYQGLSDADKEKIIRRAADKARDMAGMAMLEEVIGPNEIKKRLAGRAS